MSIFSETGGILSDKFRKLFGKIFYEETSKLWEDSLVPSLITYNARSTGEIDIRKVFNVTAEGENILKAELNKIDINIFNLEEKEKVIKIRDYVDSIMIYTADIIGYGQVEYWADAVTILQKKSDDCDGYAVLIAKLCYLAGVRKSHLKVQAVTTADNLGHANVIYLDDYDNEWYTIEGSYFAASARVNWINYIPQRNNPSYKDVWWVTDDEQSYATKGDLVIRNGIG